MTDTIYALSSAPGRAGIAVVRVSGPKAWAVLTALCKVKPSPRRAVLCTLRDAQKQPIDTALVIWMPNPKTFTGEDLVEFHVHGGRAIIEALLRTIDALAGTRPAEPGEFTRRAVENGKLDLFQAEGLIDLIDAETDAQRRQALRQYGGLQSRRLEEWREGLIRVGALAEAAIDFADEDLPGDPLAQARARAEDIYQSIQAVVKDSSRSEIVRDGLTVAIVGPPNVGKSSLLNALAKRDVVIVSDIAGTTRDVIDVRLDIGGYAVTIADTAGLRQTSDTVEREGVRRALQRAQQSDFVILMVDASVADPFADVPAKLSKDAALIVRNKIDLPRGKPLNGLNISLKTGEGLDALLEGLAKLVATRLDRAQEGLVITRARHRRALEEALQALERGLQQSEPDMFAEDLRLATRSIGRITGRVDVEELLDVLFGEFCIGK